MASKSVCVKMIDKIKNKKTKQQAVAIYYNFIKHQSTGRLKAFALARIISNKSLRESYYQKALEKESQTT